MATLPTITVSDAQVTQILAAYKAKFGTTTQAETILAFKKWLAGEVRTTVMTHEASKIDETNNAAKRTSLVAIEATLPDPATVV
jgi:hypothetical protein